MEGTVRLRVGSRVAEGAGWYTLHRVGVRRVHRGVVRVAVIGFLWAEGHSGSGRRASVAGVRGGAGARLGGAGGGRGVSARL